MSYAANIHQIILATEQYNSAENVQTRLTVVIKTRNTI